MKQRQIGFYLKLFPQKQKNFIVLYRTEYTEIADYLRELRKSPPEKIYIQWYEHEGTKEYPEVTWCEDQINDSGLCYIRQDLTEIKAND